VSKYTEIIALRDDTNNIRRGYQFEQIIRELLPWDKKPPIASSLPSEQLDGIFLWNGQAYLVESKAKKGKITPGSHDWEDFENKIRRRKNNVTGLFCSLFPVREGIYERANILIAEGHLVIVLEGCFWNEIQKSNLHIKDLLSYMNFHIRIFCNSKPPEINKITEWCYNKDATQRKIFDYCTKNSATFLRRYKSNFHSNLYITREIDNHIVSFVNNLKPSVLKMDGENKVPPKQLCIVRDYSGSGKTTLSVEIASSQNIFLEQE
jgi:hypothetical protein